MNDETDEVGTKRTMRMKEKRDDNDEMKGERRRDGRE